MKKNPLLQSQFVSEFWGRRWNLLIHHTFKRGVCKPICSLHYSAFTATVFLASGVFHEWLNHVALKYHRQGISAESIYKPENIVLESNLAFFLRCFIVVTSEKILSQNQSLQKLGTSLPRPLQQVVMTSLPCAFWFAQHNIERCELWDYERMTFMIVKLEAVTSFYEYLLHWR
mmetsp:Transcript_14572/g.31409  ORF Transcript_14572/g.31409 Transcript_14572/m.31409 type:complete len:173 (+) Transcript_14572:173-691(+)